MLAIVIGVANFTDFGGENIKSLDPGTCIDLPDSLSRVKYVDVVDCAIPHDGEVIAEANGTSEKSQRLCSEAVDALSVQAVLSLPPDAEAGTFGGLILRNCVVYSPSGGLVGSLLDG